MSAPAIAYSFSLPSGVIHGATANSGKVFFSPSDGVCWVHADHSLQKSSDTVQVNHLSLGTDEESDKSLRTGAFANERNWVLCSTGRADQSTLCLINAEAAQPIVVKVNIPVADGLRLTTPVTVLSLGKRYAFLFQDRTDAESEVQEQLTVVELDPNRDRDFGDARVKTTIPVGASKIDGHHGLHSIAFDAYGRYAVFTEPGLGIVNVFSVKDLKVVARFNVGGSPDSIAAMAAPEHFHSGVLTSVVRFAERSERVTRRFSSSFIVGVVLAGGEACFNGSFTPGAAATQCRTLWLRTFGYDVPLTS